MMATIKTPKRATGKRKTASEPEPVLTEAQMVWAMSLYRRIGNRLYSYFGEFIQGIKLHKCADKELWIWEFVARGLERFIGEYPDEDRVDTILDLLILSSGGTPHDESNRYFTLGNYPDEVIAELIEELEDTPTAELAVLLHVPPKDARHATKIKQVIMKLSKEREFVELDPRR
jgi:hypothetical protein